MLRRSLAPALFLVATVLVAALAACRAKDESAPASPCVAFREAPPIALTNEHAVATTRSSALVRVAAAAGRTYGLDHDGMLGRVDAPATSLVATAGVDFAVSKNAAGVVRAFVARWPSQAGGATTFELVRFTSADGGMTFDRASEKVVLTVPGGRAAPGEATSLAFAADGSLFVALGDASPAPGGPATLLGKVLKLDVTGDTVTPVVWAAGVHQPNGLDVDAMTGDLWLTDYSAKDDATLVYRITRLQTDALVPMLSIPEPDERVVFTGGHVYRGTLVPPLVGKYVYHTTGDAVVVVDRFGPSGPPLATKLAVGSIGPIGANEAGELVVAPAAGGLVRVTNGAPAATPTSLLATQCFDLAAPGGVVEGGIAYDVTTPLWSDGATKERFVVVPSGAKITARPDGDFVFPVGTIAVKTFSVDGKRVETRLLVQHDIEDWVGYSYAWNAAGTDAELVVGNRIAPLAGGKSWYFPSSADCSACHTPAAGYTLGLEAKQLLGRGDVLGQLEAKLQTPIDESMLAPLVSVDAPAPATNEARARSYLHANCSMCHREGSVTGNVVELDLRNDTPLAKTGLCGEAKAGDFGMTGAHVVKARDPAHSVLLARLRTLDDRRMPKLASRVVDQVGVAAVEAWIKELATCP